MVTTAGKERRGKYPKMKMSPANTDFPANSALGKMVNTKLNKINWKVLSDASEKLDGELAANPILGLVRAEVLLRGVDALTAEGRGYKEYVLLRSLGLKAWFTMATSRAGITDPLERSAVGKVLAAPTGEYNIYKRVFFHAPKAADGDWTGFADGLAEDVKAAAAALTDDDRNTTKQRYDKGVTAAHFQFIEAQVGAATAAAAAAKPGDAPKVVAVLVPWMDAGAAPTMKKVGDVEGTAAVVEEEDAAAVAEAKEAEGKEMEFESMFETRGKKKKNRIPGMGAGAAAAAMAAAGLGGGKLPSLDAVLSQLAKNNAEPTFPDVEAWVGPGGGAAAQATSSEAVAVAASLALAAPTGATIVVPSALFASVLTFDLGTLGGERRVMSPAQAAAAEADWVGEGKGAAVFITFDPCNEAGAGDADMAAAAAAAKTAGQAVVVCSVAMAQKGGCDAVKGPEGAEQAAADAVARAAARLKVA